MFNRRRMKKKKAFADKCEIIALLHFADIKKRV